MVAIETALVGWLAYWLFLVYANNPAVGRELVSALSRFPQLSFTTVDIAVLVIIGIMSTLLAFKFQRGLRPGIRLERALQMLENLMKRNLVLESQVAEMKLEKAHVTTSTAVNVSGHDEPRPGSWEKAFRTPLEAGPPVPASSVPRLVPRQPTNSGEGPVEREVPALRPPSHRPEPKAFQPGLASKPAPSSFDRFQDRPPKLSDERKEKLVSQGGGRFSSTWEDSPRRISENTGVLTPSQPRKAAAVVPEVTSQRQPYIPAPAPPFTPPSVIMGPGYSPPAVTRPLSRVPVAQPSSRASAGTGRSSGPVAIKPRAPLAPVVTGLPKPPVAEPKLAEQSKPPMEEPKPAELSKPSTAEAKATEQSEPRVTEPEPETSKPPAKPEPVKKKFPYEEDQ